MKCPSCQQEVSIEAAFCPRCGARMSAGDAAAETLRAPQTTDTVTVPGKAPPASDPATATAGPTGAAGAASPQSRLAASAPTASTEPEQVLWTGRYSGKDMVGTWIVLGLVSAALIAAVVLVESWRTSMTAWLVVAGLIIVMWLLGMLVVAYRKLSISYELTNKRFIHRQGILFQTTDRIELIDIDDVTQQQSILGRLFNVGQITIHSTDQTHPQLKLRGISDVHRVADLIDAARRRERERRALHIERI